MVTAIFAKNDVCATLQPVCTKCDVWHDDVISKHGCCLILSV